MAEKNVKILFLFYFYLRQNLDILTYKYDTYLFFKEMANFSEISLAGCLCAHVC
jgi:hypothetical protein